MNISAPNVSYISPLGPTIKRVYWTLGNKCTYACSYCPKDFHSGTIPYPSIETIQQVFKAIPRSVVMFGGGEPTYHPDFERILEEKPRNVQIGVSSNLARPISFWERVAPKLISVIATYHAEYASLERFVETAKLIYQQCGVLGQVTLVMLPSKWDECVTAFERLVSEGLPVTAKPILNTIDSEEANVYVIPDYTPDQLVWIEKNNNSDGRKVIGLYNKDDILVDRTSTGSIIASKYSFKGWTCYTPVNNLLISKSGDVYDMSCNQRSKLGNIVDGFNVPTEPVVCSQNLCWCTSDLIQRKSKPNV